MKSLGLSLRRWAVGTAAAALVVGAGGCTGYSAPNGHPASISLTGLISGPSPVRPLPPSFHADCGAPITYRVIEPGFGSDWSKTYNRIAFNMKGPDGLYHVYTVRPDGADLTRFGVNNPDFPDRTTGSPSWDPTAPYMAFVAEKAVHPGRSNLATPGWGGYSDLWVATADGSRVWRLTDVPDDANHGTILPQFSPNGKLLEWTERVEAPDVLRTVQAAGFWVIKVARFNVSATGVPYLTDVQTVSPGGLAFNETGGFSADSTTMLFTSDFETQNFWYSQIYSLNLSTGQIRQLTSGHNYNEHPRFTPDGRIIWMSSLDEPHAIEWWIMNADGSDPSRLSSFNSPSTQPHLARAAYPTVVDTDSWSADGTFFYGDVETSLITAASVIVRVSLTCPS